MDQHDTDALLRSGNNELQALVFKVGKQQFGVNVAKLDELIMPPKTRTWPGQHEAIMGAFHLRSENMALVDLGRYINPEAGPTTNGSTVIVTSFNNSKIAFLVDSVDQILRVDWGMVGPPSVASGSKGVITGIMKYNESLIPMLDFEAINDDVSGTAQIDAGEGGTYEEHDRSNISAVIVEDSCYMSARIEHILKKAGLTSLEVYNNGAEAFDALKDRTLESKPDIIISDIEMPRMDGLTMTRKLKELKVYEATPIVLFSSIITPPLLHKGKRAGADAQLNKGDVNQLVSTLDWLMFPDIPLTQAGAA